MLKYYLVLLSSISLLVILSKCYLSCITSLRCELSLTFIFGNKAGDVVAVNSSPSSSALCSFS